MALHLGPMKTPLLSALCALAFVAGCGEDPEGTESADPNGCVDGKCDDPNTEAQDACEAAARTAVLESREDSCQSGESDSDCFRRVMAECRDEAAVQHCEGRRGEALECTAESRGSSFTSTSIRWQCADVDGVSRGSKFDSSLPNSSDVERGEGRDGSLDASADRFDEDEQVDPEQVENKPDSRGQEYCEYFALVQLPGEDAPREVGRLLEGGRSTTDHDLSDMLDDDLRDMLDDEDDAVFGQCVFTSWHQDVDVGLEICDEDPEACQWLRAIEEPASWVEEKGLRFDLDADNLQMKISINSNGAAMDLVDQCMVDPELHDRPAPLSPDFDDEFMRGCLRSYELFTTEWRRSDPAVCAAAMRLTECGCGLDVDGDSVIDIAAGDKLPNGREEIARILVPSIREDSFLRGFQLGTWTDPTGLPDGCHFVDITAEGSSVNRGAGEHGQNLVVCDITAERVETAGFTLDQAFSDMKTFCQATYAQDVVVHVPLAGNHIPEAEFICNPPEGAANCEGLPVVVGAETGTARDGICE